MVCGAGLTCTGTACVVDPASRWNVALDDVTVPSTNYAGAAWDAFGGAPDPVVNVRVGSATATPTLSDGPDDVFMINFAGHVAAMNVRASDLEAYLGFEVDDEDVTDYEFIGGCYVTLTEAAFLGTVQTVNCPVDASQMGSGFLLHYHLEQF